MKLDQNGAVISNVTAAQISNLGNDFVCMWDSEGLPIHIHKDVIEYLYNGTHPQPTPEIDKPDKGLLFFQEQFMKSKDYSEIIATTCGIMMGAIFLLGFIVNIIN